MSRQCGRRKVLGGIGAAAIGLSGCTSRVERALGGGGFDHGTADYLSSLPTPEALGRSGRYNTFVDSPLGADVSEADEFEFTLSGTPEGAISVSEVDTRVRFGDISVLSGTFDSGEVTDALEDEEAMTRLGGKAGYERYESDEGRFAYGVGNPLVIGNAGLSSGDRVLPQVNATIETVTDNADAYGDVNPAIAATARLVGSPTFGSFDTVQNLDLDSPEDGVYPGKVAEGYAWTVRGEQTNVSDVLAFESEDAVTVEGLRTWVENNGGERERFEHYENVSYRQEGVLGIIDATVPTTEL